MTLILLNALSKLVAPYKAIHLRTSEREGKLYLVVFSLKVKVKVTLVQVLRLCTGRTAHRGIRGVALPFHDHGTRRG